MGSDTKHGHTGLVTKVDPDGTIHTVEMGWHINHAWEGTYKPDQYRGVMTFAHCAKFLKGDAPVKFEAPKNASID